MMVSVYDYWSRQMGDIPIVLQLALVIAFSTGSYIIFLSITFARSLSKFPIVALAEQGLNARSSWHKAGTETIAKGIREHNGPFQVITGTGPKIVLPNRYADELRNRPELSFQKAHEKDFFTSYPGFEAHRFGLTDGSAIQETVRVKLTQSLDMITPDLVDETISAIHDIFGENPEWQHVLLKQDTLHLVARLSSRAFLGQPLCTNERWLEIAKNYTVDSFVASFKMRMVPALVRPFCFWFIDECSRIRAQVRDARMLITPEVERRKKGVQEALELGQKQPRIADAIGWMYEISRADNLDYVAGQLSLTLAAIHTTTEAITYALLDLCNHPELIGPLRQEITTVLPDDDYSRPSIQKLRLLDSFLKESQRHHPSDSATMNRYVTKTIQLSDGTKIPGGTRIMVAGVYEDPSVYREPEKFDGYRFLDLDRCQKPVPTTSWAYVATSAKHMGFGYGQHACPGRFFASLEIKMVLCQLLLKYDLRIIDGAAPKTVQFETSRSVDPTCKILLKRRTREV